MADFALIGSTRTEDCQSMLGWETLDNKLSIQTFTTQAYDSNSNVNDELVGAPDPSFETLDHIDPDV